MIIQAIFSGTLWFCFLGNYKLKITECVLFKNSLCVVLSMGQQLQLAQSGSDPLCKQAIPFLLIRFSNSKVSDILILGNTIISQHYVLLIHKISVCRFTASSFLSTCIRPTHNYLQEAMRYYNLHPLPLSSIFNTY